MVADSVASEDGRLVVHFGSSATMDEVADESVDLVVTSPPYGVGLKYGTDGKGGYSGTPGQIESPVTTFAEYEAYISRLEPVWRETYRKMRPGAYAAVNVGCLHAKAEYFGHSFVFPTSERIWFYWTTSLGAEYRWKYVWISMRNRTNGTANPPVYFGSYPRPLEGQVLREIEDILIFRKPPLDGSALTDERRERRERSKLTREQWRESFNQVWEFPGVSSETSNGATHPAVFPIAIPRRIILGYSVKDDLILDPFLGTGTTLLACRELDRRGVGYEVERSYEGLVVSKTSLGASTMSEY